MEVIGEIEPRDDLPHEPGPEPTYNDSAYVNAFGADSGGFVRIGNRVNEGYAEVTLCWFEPDGSVLFDHQRPEITTGRAFDAGGLRIEILEPLRRLRVRYEGEVIHLEDPAALADPASAFTTSPRREVALSLDVGAIGPALGARPADFGGGEASFLTGHLEQHVAASGTISRDGVEEDVEARGLRDRSWGPRVWQALASYRWLNVAFDEDRMVMATRVDHGDGRTTCDGAVIEPGGAQRITEVAVRGDLTDPDPGGIEARLTLADGTDRVMTGTVEASVPLRDRRDGNLTRIGEHLTRYRLGGVEALGIAEALDQVQ